MSNIFNDRLNVIKHWLYIILGKTAVTSDQGEGKVYSLDSVKGFYNDLTKKVGEGTDLDSEGIAVSLLPDQTHVYFPVAIIQYGLANYDLWLMYHEEKYKLSFFKHLQWTIDNQRSDGSFDAFGAVRSKKYTVGAMCQGEAAALLIRGYIETKDSRYLRAAKKALDFMLIPVEKGGTTYYVKENLVLAEYPARDEFNPILNGWIFAFFGLYDYFKITNDFEIEKVLNTTVRSLLYYIEYYDREFWSNYDLNGKIASPHYQRIHVALLEVMYKITNEEKFNLYAKKWEKERNLKRNRYKAILIKIKQKMMDRTIDAVILK